MITRTYFVSYKSFNDRGQLVVSGDFTVVFKSFFKPTAETIRGEAKEDFKRRYSGWDDRLEVIITCLSRIS